MTSPQPFSRRSLDFLQTYVSRFIEDEALAARIVTVLTALPPDVQTDLVEDPGFCIALEDYVPGRGSVVWMQSPGNPTRGHRSIVLRPRLRTCPVDFAHYVIAHELAHAYLWNGGWGEITDREHAADALAASWGFLRPTSGPTGCSADLDPFQIVRYVLRWAASVTPSSETIRNCRLPN